MLKVARHHFKMMSDFPHFSDEDSEAGGIEGEGLLKGLSPNCRAGKCRVRIWTQVCLTSKPV